MLLKLPASEIFFLRLSICPLSFYIYFFYSWYDLDNSFGCFHFRPHLQYKDSLFDAHFHSVEKFMHF